MGFKNTGFFLLTVLSMGSFAQDASSDATDALPVAPASQETLDLQKKAEVSRQQLAFLNGEYDAEDSKGVKLKGAAQMVGAYYSGKYAVVMHNTAGLYSEDIKSPAFKNYSLEKKMGGRVGLGISHISAVGFGLGAVALAGYGIYNLTLAPGPDSQKLSELESKMGEVEVRLASQETAIEDSKVADRVVDRLERNGISRTPAVIESVIDAQLNKVEPPINTHAK